MQSNAITQTPQKYPRCKCKPYVSMPALLAQILGSQLELPHAWPNKTGITNKILNGFFSLAARKRTSTIQAQNKEINQFGLAESMALPMGFFQCIQYGPPNNSRAGTTS
ncbi:MAG: hypothetical protein AAB877_02405 [Patescibacteria group bacterium]